MAVQRHKAHVPARLAQALATQETARTKALAREIGTREAKEIAQADDLLTGIVTLRERLETALKDSTVAKDVAALSRELRETLRLMLELEGRLRQGAHVAVAIVTNPEWIAIRTRLLRALEPYPEAQRAVVGALSEVSAR